MKTLFALVFCIQAYLVLSDECSPDPCPPSTTCCPTGIPGLVGCCPVPNAVCCSDKQHCCPQNTVCNLEKGTCDNETVLLPFRKQKLVASVIIKKAKRLDNVYCPDGLSYCPDGTTCCKLQTGEYGCCPYPSAICCSDGIHCCPSGTTCDPTSTYCQSSSFWDVAPTRKRWDVAPTRKRWDVAPTRKRKPALSLPIVF